MNIKFLIFIFAFLIFSLPLRSEAALIVQAPKYIGLNSGLVGYWSFNAPDMANVTAFDRSGNANNGTLTNGPAVMSGKIGQGLNFDGSNDYVALPNGVVSNCSSGTFTITAWVYASTRNAWATILKNWGDTVGGCFHFGLESTTGELSLYIQQSDGTQAGPAKDGNTALPTDSWQFVTAVADGNIIKVYRNTILGATTASYNGTLKTSFNFTNIGAKPGDVSNVPVGASQGYWSGKIDDVRMYNRALSADEIKRLYHIGATLKVNTSINNDSLAKGLVGYWSFDGKDMVATSTGSAALDRSGNNNTGYLQNGPARTLGKIGQALSFDGSNDYVNAGNIGATTKSVSFWVKPNTTTQKIVNLSAVAATAVSVRASSQNADGVGSTAISVAAPAGTTAGDVVVVAITTDTFNKTVSDNNGSTPFTNDGAFQDGVVTMRMTVFSRRIQAGDPSTYNFTLSATDDWSAIAVAFQNPHASVIYDVAPSATYNSATTGTNIDTPDITTLTGNAIHLIFAGRDGTGNTITGDPGEYTLDQNVTTANARRSRAAHKTIASASATGVQAFTMDTGAARIGLSMAIRNNADVGSGSSVEISGGTVTANGFTSPSIYVDGVSGSTVDTSWRHVVITTDTAVDSSTFEIGRITSTYCNCQIDDVRVYNRVLSSDEIKRLYKIGATLKVNTDVSRYNPDLERGLVGYWSFDGKDMADNGIILTSYDRSGQNNHGSSTIGTTAPTKTIGKIGQGLRNSQGKYVELDTAVITGTPFSACAWFYHEGGADTFIFIGDKDVSNQYHRVQIRSDNQVQVRSTNGATVGTAASITTHSLNAWNHACGVWTSSTLRTVYLNGKDEGSNTTNVTPVGPDRTTIGRNGDSTPDDYFTGIIDDVRIYNRALSPDEIKRLYNLGR